LLDGLDEELERTTTIRLLAALGRFAALLHCSTLGDALGHTARTQLDPGM
jgi:hypothetical protein